MWTHKVRRTNSIRNPKKNQSSSAKVEPSKNATKLQSKYLVLFLSLLLSNVEIPQFVNIPLFVGSNYPKPISHIVLLQVFLCQILEVPATIWQSIHRKHNESSRWDKWNNKKNIWYSLTTWEVFTEDNNNIHPVALWYYLALNRTYFLETSYGSSV